MRDLERAPDAPLVIGSVEELLAPATRRRFLRTLGAGGSVLLLPTLLAGCDDDDDPLGPDIGPGNNLDGLTFDLRTDTGIFRFTHTLEIVEGYFYTQVVTKSDFGSLFNAEEREVLTDIRNVEVIHREVLRAALGAQAVPDFTSRLNATTLTAALASRESILATARLLEHTGVATLNGAGKYIKDARNLLFAGKLASVEARHAAALRDIAPPAGIDAATAFAGDDITDANGRDVKLEATTTLTRVKALNIVAAPLNANLTISNAPDASQGAPTADFFPTTP